jgi:hypothetical protein
VRSALDPAVARPRLSLGLADCGGSPSREFTGRPPLEKKSPDTQGRSALQCAEASHCIVALRRHSDKDVPRTETTVRLAVWP